MADNDLGDISSQFLCNALMLSKSIVELNLNENKIGLLGFRYLADLLKDGLYHIRQIDLSYNKVCSDALKYIIMACKLSSFQTAIITSNKNVVPILLREALANENDSNIHFFSNCTGFMKTVMTRIDLMPNNDSFNLRIWL